jgi:hypothetical protein
VAFEIEYKYNNSKCNQLQGQVGLPQQLLELELLPIMLLPLEDKRKSQRWMRELREFVSTKVSRVS